MITFLIPETEFIHVRELLATVASLDNRGLGGKNYTLLFQKHLQRKVKACL